jgi:DNA-binding CsgD family transcriptional regulator
MARKTSGATIDTIALMERLTGLDFATIVERIATLSEREYEAFLLMGQGETNDAIKARLGISDRNLAYLRSRVMLKLQAERQLGALYWLFRIGNELRPDMLDEARRKQNAPVRKEVKELEDWRAQTDG